MNKKYIIAAVALLSFSHVLLPLEAFTAQQKQVRLSTLWNLHANNALTIAQFIENEHSMGTIIDRDIMLLEKDSEQALKQKASAEGFISNKMIPGMLKGVAVISGGIATLGAAFSGISTLAAYRVWNKDNDSQVSYPGFLTAFYLAILTNGGARTEAEKRANTLVDDDHPNKSHNSIALASGSVAPFTAVAALVLAGVSKYTFSKNTSLNNKNADFIQEKQDQFNRDQTIIAQLKQLKYDNNL